jgi:hypothetical protein
VLVMVTVLPALVVPTFCEPKVVLALVAEVKMPSLV